MTNQGSVVEAVPTSVGLPDGDALLDNVRLPASEQTFQRLDPAADRQTPVLNMKKAVATGAGASRRSQDDTPPACQL